MSGHSKWASIKHKKAATDAKRGKLFSRVIKEITVAARQGGGDMDANPRLRTAVQKAKDSNMPADNIDRAIKKGTGELPGTSYDEQVYEGYGVGGVAIMVDTLTDNKNRSASEIRSIFSKNNGNLAGVGSVAWIFNKKGYITVPMNLADEETLFLAVTESGAEDFKAEEDQYEIYTDPSALEAVKEAVKNAGIEYEVAEITYLPQNTIKIADIAETRQVLRLIDALEEHDDVQNVYANFDIPDEILAQLESDS
ncbi:MAG: YebC/PmpR family DNA-binding transcriptional regulator [Candidatus Theseobacter exili]|nr:YebC/PmpR family DNA-binding transcriptional regulator [Candidatus Theseobacter exili]